MRTAVKRVVTCPLAQRSTDCRPSRAKPCHRFPRDTAATNPLASSRVRALQLLRRPGLLRCAACATVLTICATILTPILPTCATVLTPIPAICATILTPVHPHRLGLGI